MGVESYSNKTSELPSLYNPASRTPLRKQRDRITSTCPSIDGIAYHDPSVTKMSCIDTTTTISDADSQPRVVAILCTISSTYVRMLITAFFFDAYLWFLSCASLRITCTEWIQFPVLWGMMSISLANTQGLWNSIVVMSNAKHLVWWLYRVNIVGICRVTGPKLAERVGSDVVP